MAKERVIKPMTEEQRRRILETPGVVIRERQGAPAVSLPEPKLRARTPISARELIGRDADDEYQDERLS